MSIRSTSDMREIGRSQTKQQRDENIVNWDKGVFSPVLEGRKSSNTRDQSTANTKCEAVNVTTI